MRTSPWAALAFALLSSSPAAAGWQAKQTETTPQGKTLTKELRYDHHRLRTDAEDQSVIIDFESGGVVMLDHREKRYAKASLQELVQMRDETKAQMRARVAEMPAEMRNKFEKMVAEQEASWSRELVVEKTARTDKVLGIACQYYRWKLPEVDGETCVAAELPVDVKAYLADAVALGKKLRAAGASPANSLELLQLASQGFSLKTKRSFSTGPLKFEAQSEIAELKAAAIPREDLEVPKYYKKLGFKEFTDAM